MTLGQRIQEHRIKLGLSQEGLGEKLGVSRQAVSRWEADGAVPDTDKLIALSKLFGITLNELLQVENPPAREEKRPRVRWRALLLAAVCFLAGLLAGRAPDLAARLAPPDLKELIADCGFTVSGHPDDAEAVDLFVWVLVEDPAALEGGEVFFLAETAGGETYRSEPTDMQESMEGVSCSATLTVPNEAMSVYVGLRRNGREQLQIMSDYK